MKITIEIPDLDDEDYTDDSEEDIIDRVYDDPYMFFNNAKWTIERDKN